MQLLHRRHETSRQPNSVRSPRNAWKAIKFWVSVLFLSIWFCYFCSFTSKYGLGPRKARKTRRPHHSYQSRVNLSNLLNQDPFAWDNYVHNITKGNILHRSDWIYSKSHGWDEAPIVIPEYNLLFFTVPKTGTTIFKQLFRRMMGFENWQLKDANLVHFPDENGLKYLYDYPPTEANEMLTSPNWTRAIFVRDPKNRVLSAYLDKALHNRGEYVKHHCCYIMTPSAFGNAAAPPLNAAGSSLLGGENSLRDRHTREHMKKGKRQGMRFPGRRLSEIIAGDYGTPRDFQQPGNYVAPPPKGIFQNRFGTTDSRAANAYLPYDAMGSRDKLGPDPPNSPGPNGPGVVQGTIITGLDFPRLPPFCNSLGDWVTPVNATVFPFEKFVEEFLDGCDDPHWRPQSKRLPSKIWPYINFVGDFETIEQDTQTLLTQLGAWEKYGATNWGDDGGSIFSTNTAVHKTSAGDQVNTYYTPRIEEMVMKHYAVDYNHPSLNFTGLRKTN